MYKVTVVASGGKQEVEVTVTDEDEPGKVDVRPASAAGYPGSDGHSQG